MSGDDKDGPLPLFVERETYRQRRLADAARALPILGVMLWMVPLLWGLPEQGPSAASSLVFLFLVWAFLIALSALIIAALGRAERRAQNEKTGK